MGNKLVYGVIAVVLLLGVFLPVGKESRTVVERVGESLGAVNTPFFSIGNVNLYGQGTTALTQATNTVICSIQSPAGTSTLQHGGIQLTTATSGVTTLVIWKATTGAGQAGGNAIASSSVASGAYKTLEITGTTTAGGYVFSPNTYFNVAQIGGGVLNQSGSCTALWQVM